MVGEVVATGALAGSAETPGEGTAGGDTVGDPVTACKTLLFSSDPDSKVIVDVSTIFPLNWAETTAKAMTETIRRDCMIKIKFLDCFE